MWCSNSSPAGNHAFRPMRLLMLVPLILTLLQAALGVWYLLMLLPVAFWGLASVSDLRDMADLVSLLLRCLLPVAANVVLWRCALYVCEPERRTRPKTVFYCVAAPISLLVACGFLLYLFGFLWL